MSHRQYVLAPFNIHLLIVRSCSWPRQASPSLCACFLLAFLRLTVLICWIFLSVFHQIYCNSTCASVVIEYCSFFHHILYCWTNRNKCARQLLQSFISVNLNITSMATTATRCQPLPPGLTLPTMPERHLSRWCPWGWGGLHRSGLQSFANSMPLFGCLMISCYGYPSRISSNIRNINCRSNYRIIKHSIV